MKTSDLKQLNSEYKKDGSSILVFYGRRGCELDASVKEFVKDKEFFYYRAKEVSAELQIAMFAQKIQRQYKSPQCAGDYAGSFRQMYGKDGGKLVLVIDSFEHIVKKDQSFFLDLVKLKEQNLCHQPVMIVLCSTSPVWVEQKMIPALGELAKKIDSVHKISGFKFLDVVRAFPSFSVRESVEVYGILGGVPAYIKCWDPQADRKTNICRNILNPDGVLFQEAERYLRAELRELSVYNTILTEIAAGKRKLNDLYQSTGYSRAKISVYLKNLMELDVVEKVVSFETGGWENTQKGIYQIKDTYINFWFKFVFSHLSELYLLSPEEFYEQYMEGEMETYLNRYFVQVCMEYMKLLNQIGKLPIQMTKMGTWVGKQGDIDIVAQNAVRENIVGICNWSEKKMTYARYQQLTELMKQAKIRAKQIYLFSATEFEEELVKTAEEDERFFLIDMTEL